MMSTIFAFELPDKLKSWLQSNSCTIFADTTCDGCSKLPISGTRYKCLECVSYNLCQSCVDSGTFHVEHILGVIMNAHVNEFVTSIQKPGYIFKTCSNLQNMSDG